MFVPWKIYPALFLCSAVLFFVETYKLNTATLFDFIKKPWFIFLTIFAIYASISYFVSYGGQGQQVTNFLKLLINVVFFCTSMYWLSMRDNTRLLRMLDVSMHLLFLLCFIQLMLYHANVQFQLITGAASSAKASALYNQSLFIWGLSDKNMFGARLALLGFAYIILPMARKNQINCWRILYIFLLAYLSLSRTPIVALLIGIFFLLWFFSKKPFKIGILIMTGALLPFVARKLVRVEHLTASNDGMGVRITYWKAFFQHFEAISPFGNGFLKGGDFLQQYAAYYHGEPHIHNTFLSCYLEFGWIGFISYSLFLLFFYLYCIHINPIRFYWLAAFLPLIAIMMILYSGYDNDIIFYLLLIFAVGSSKEIVKEEIKIKR